MPFNDYRPDLMGKADVEPKGRFPVGSWGSFTLTYTAGKFGIDDRGSLKIAFRGHADITALQTTDPSAPGYTSVEASNGAELEVVYEVRRNIRPWNKALFIRCLRYLNEGDQLIIRIGDQRRGSPGIRLQTIAEETFEFRFLIDPFACYDFVPLPDSEQPVIAMVPSDPVAWKAVWPTLRRPGESFRLSIKSEDRWGNPTDRFSCRLTLVPSQPVSGLPEYVNFREGQFSEIIENLAVDTPGLLTLDVQDENGKIVCAANPLIIRETPHAHYWSDMHGQSEETIGTNSAREYFLFGRDKAFLDICAHQGNDFQITDTFWNELNSLTSEFDVPGRFVAVPGYEWSGNTSLGGDHNVWYRTEGRPIYRSCRSLIPDRTHPENDCHTVVDLFEKLKDEDALVVAHVGGRYADVKYAHDANLEPSVEVHSSWGTFEWIVRDALEAGYRIGIVASSDGHKGRPGASYPGPAEFGSYGGLTCHLLPELNRGELFSAFRERRHYATTGARIFLAVTADFEIGAATATGNTTKTCEMGSIVSTTDDAVRLNLEVVGSAPIERIDIFDGLDHQETIRPWEGEELKNRLRIVCAGQEYRGRGRLVRWTGEARLSSGEIKKIQPVNFWNPDRQPEQTAPNAVTWRTVTTGGASSLDLWLSDEAWNGKVNIETNEVSVSVSLADVGYDGIQHHCGGMDKRLEIQRLPAILTERHYQTSRRFSLSEDQEARLFVRVTQEDGHQAWSSPIYIQKIQIKT